MSTSPTTIEPAVEPAGEPLRLLRETTDLDRRIAEAEARGYAAGAEAAAKALEAALACAENPTVNAVLTSFRIKFGLPEPGDDQTATATTSRS
jgi:hypothetical protein